MLRLPSICLRCQSRVYAAAFAQHAVRNSVAGRLYARPARHIATERNESPLLVSDGPERLQQQRKPDKIKPKADDAYDIGEKILKLLKAKDERKVAVLLKQKNELDMTVCWNYVVRDRMAQGKTNAALADYQQMKKLGQRPNAQTYTILLDGLSMNAGKVQVERMRKVVADLIRDEHVETATVHLNAALAFCQTSRATGLELAYELIEQFGQAGVKEHDAVTYTMLFRMMGPLIHDRDSPQRAELLEDARRLWLDIQHALAENKLNMDDRLLSAWVNCMSAGSKEDALHALQHIAIAANLTLPEDAQPTKPIENMRLRRRLVARDNLAQSILHLLAQVGQPALVDTFWPWLVRETFHGAPPARSWHLYLRTLVATSDRERAVAAINAMRKQDAELVDAQAYFLAMQAHVTRDDTTLRLATAFYTAVRGEAGSVANSHMPLVSTFVRILRLSRTATDEDNLAAVDALVAVDWADIAERIAPPSRSEAADLALDPIDTPARGGRSGGHGDRRLDSERRLLRQALNDLHRTLHQLLKHRPEDRERAHRLHLLQRRVWEANRIAFPDSVPGHRASDDQRRPWSERDETPAFGRGRFDKRAEPRSGFRGSSRDANGGLRRVRSSREQGSRPRWQSWSE